MSIYVDKPLSLIERKKQQWAKEREELAALGTPWSAPKQLQTYERTLQRNRYVSKFAMSKTNEHFCQDNTATSQPSSRRSSLPPLYKNHANNTSDRSDMDKGGETSGYGSDNQQQHQIQYWNHHHQSGYESSSSYKDDRPKWKDQKRFWEMKDENEPPNWVKRGLQNDEEIVVVSNSSPAESPQHDDELDDRPYTSYSNSIPKSFIRGQNIRVDSVELAEREQKRQIALAHQQAIRQQLEEREARRRQEREQRIREERDEELRIEREQEIERQRKEYELRLIKEKQEREQKRKEAIQEALQQAEKEAQLEKIKLKLLKQNKSEEDNEMKANNVAKKQDNNNIDNNDNTDKNNGVLEQKPEILNNEINNKKMDLEKSNRPKSVNEAKNDSLNAINNNINDNNKVPASVQILQTPRSDNLAFVVQTPIENLQNLQYAVLVSNLGATSIPIAIPVVPSTTEPSVRTENRLLTPTTYRDKNRKLCDCSTQTDFVEIYNNPANNNIESKCIKEKLTNLDYDNRNTTRKPKVVEERPKWNANRPPTRYLKQSEKDLLYQRRKLRQKARDSATTKENSSDDSPTNSPRSYRKNFVEKRHHHHSRPLWRKNDYFTRNFRMYQTEIVPLQSDKNQIYYQYDNRHHYRHRRENCGCCCPCNCGDGRIDILKIEHNSSTPLSTTREQILPNCGRNLENTEYIIDKLTSLHNDLMMKQEHWEKSPRTPSLSSSARNTENNS